MGKDEKDEKYTNTKKESTLEKGEQGVNFLITNEEERNDLKRLWRKKNDKNNWNGKKDEKNCIKNTKK